MSLIPSLFSLMLTPHHHQHLRHRMSFHVFQLTHNLIQICAGQIGCAYNMPSHAYESTEFTECEGDLQMEPGLYVEDGQSTLSIVFMCSPCSNLDPP